MGFSKVDARDRVQQEQKALRGILDKGLSRDELHQLAASFATLPVDPDRWGDFERKLVWATIESFLSSGDRNGLVLILSLRCPRRIAWLNTEHYLAVFGSTFKDPITVLGKRTQSARYLRLVRQSQTRPAALLPAPAFAGRMTRVH